jgi:D-alanyl-D-alanine carboxypeptidase
MQAAARAHRIELDPESGFRTAEQQRVLYERYLAGTGHQAARPGYSNHQAGRSIDLHVGGYESATYRWLSAHAGQFGFRDDVRGEYWHWTFFPSGS